MSTKTSETIGEELLWSGGTSSIEVSLHAKIRKCGPEGQKVPFLRFRYADLPVNIIAPKADLLSLIGYKIRGDIEVRAGIENGERVVSLNFRNAMRRTDCGTSSHRWKLVSYRNLPDWPELHAIKTKGYSCVAIAPKL